MDGYGDEIVNKIGLQGTLDEEQRLRLLEIADRSPVHRTFQKVVKIRTEELRE